jgi:hypothetical protein
MESLKVNLFLKKYDVTVQTGKDDKSVGAVNVPSTGRLQVNT